MIKTLWVITLALFQLVWADITATKQIRIVSTANVHGETDPCG